MLDYSHVKKSERMKMTNNMALQLTAQIPSPIGSFDAYVRRVREIPLLSAEEEYDLAVRLQEAGDLVAAQRLVLSHLRYVLHVARGYLGYGLPLADLVQEGTVGLMKAVKRFKPERGVRLVSFAVHWIKSEIHEFVIKNWRIVKIATTKAQRKLFFNLRGAKRRLGWSSREEVAHIAEELGVDSKEVYRMEARLTARDDSLDQLTSGEEDANQPVRWSLREALKDGATDPALAIENENWEGQVDGRLYAALQQLDGRSQKIIERRWLQADKATLQLLGEQYGVSPERIRQLEKIAFKKLRTYLAEFVV